MYPTDWTGLGPVNLRFNRVEAANTVAVIARATAICFFCPFVIMNRAKNVISKVGAPLYRKLVRNIPASNRIFEYFFPWIIRAYPATANRKPEVIGMSCQSVMPIAPIKGVIVRIAALQSTNLFVKRVLAKTATENPSNCEKKSVAISGCVPFIDRNFTNIAQIAVDSLVRVLLRAISMLPKESVE